MCLLNDEKMAEEVLEQLHGRTDVITEPVIKVPRKKQVRKSKKGKKNGRH